MAMDYAIDFWKAFVKLAVNEPFAITSSSVWIDGIAIFYAIVD
jgi:hypothetical protein